MKLIVSLRWKQEIFANVYKIKSDKGMVSLG